MSEVKETTMERIARRRQEQIEKHDFSVEYDAVNNDSHQLVVAAANLCYLGDILSERDIAQRCPFGWNKARWDKMMTDSYEERLVTAAALLAAEVDREDWVAKYKPQDGGGKA